MKRTIFHLAMAASLVLAIVISTVWILGIRKTYYLYSTPWTSAPGTYYQIWTSGGGVVFIRDDHYRGLKSSKNIEIREISSWSIILMTHRCYDGVDSGSGVPAYRIHSLFILCLPLLLASLILPTIALFQFLHHLRHRHSDPTLCPHCHYDLRAHHPDQNCPECGTPILPHPKSQTTSSTST